MTDKETEQKINQLQIYEQSVQNILLQKQQFQAQITEFDSAIKELKSTKKAYRIIGNIMVASDTEDIKKDIETRKSAVELRIKTLEKQEENIKEKTKNLQAEVMKNIDTKEK